MAVYEIDPLQDPRWNKLVLLHPNSSAFHTCGWLEALKNTYRYKPIAYTTSHPDADLINGIVFCRVSSILTGKRLVSLPFSDHVQPLANADECSEITDFLQKQLGKDGIRYFEIRPLSDTGLIESNEIIAKSKGYYLNLLDLEPDLDSLFSNFHKNCVQRVIKRALRDGIQTEVGTSPEILQKFYQLMLKTRRRHLLPPQPLAWFENLIKCMGSAIKIRVASKDNQPVSALLTISHRKSIIYKYGCSDEQHFNLGGIFALFWEMIQDAKQAGITLLDLGRSDMDGEGLIQFKDRWGSRRMEISYYRSPAPKTSMETGAAWRNAMAQRIFPFLPDSVLILIGKALYRHTG